MNKLLKAWNYLQARLKEPSTHASVAALATMAGMNIEAGPIHDGLTAAGVVQPLGYWNKVNKIDK